MTKSDDAILQVLADTGAALDLKALEVNCHMFHDRIHYNTAKRRVPMLLEAGLIERLELNERFVRITDDGRAYLKGEFTPPDLDD